MELKDIAKVGKAETLVEALPYIQKYHGKTLVVKYGGNAMINEDLKADVMKDVVLLSLIGIRIVLVHGGGPDISGMLKRVGIETKFQNGLRVTDAETMKIAQMVLCGKTNKDLVNHIQRIGGKAVGISGIDDRMIRAHKLDEQLGFVGAIDDVHAEVIENLLDGGYVPVVSTIGTDDDGNVYNINADTAAARIAAELGAENFILLTDIAGVLADPKNPDSRIPKLTVTQAKELMASGVIAGGMIPKTECCIDAIERGVKKVVMLDGRVSHAILVEVLSDAGVGTMIVG